MAQHYYVKVFHLEFTDDQKMNEEWYEKFHHQFERIRSVRKNGKGQESFGRLRNVIKDVQRAAHCCETKAKYLHAQYKRDENNQYIRTLKEDATPTSLCVVIKRNACDDGRNYCFTVQQIQVVKDPYDGYSDCVDLNMSGGAYVWI